jgi:hypothetical protein
VLRQILNLRKHRSNIVDQKYVTFYVLASAANCLRHPDLAGDGPVEAAASTRPHDQVGADVTAGPTTDRVRWRRCLVLPCPRSIASAFVPAQAQIQSAAPSRLFRSRSGWRRYEFFWNGDQPAGLLQQTCRPTSTNDYVYRPRPCLNTDPRAMYILFELKRSLIFQIVYATLA